MLTLLPAYHWLPKAESQIGLCARNSTVAPHPLLGSAQKEQQRDQRREQPVAGSLVRRRPVQHLFVL